MKEHPQISILTVTYNRANLVHRAIESVLKQTYQNFEIILVDNGSTDHTQEVLSKYANHEKIRWFQLPVNQGAGRGYNFALDQIKGEWFTILPDDDEIVEDALETLIKIPEEIDPSINAVTCNSIDSITGKFSGFGLEKDQFLPLQKIISQCSGQFWGITKTELLGEKRINENLLGYANAFWHQIDAIANRYYIHQGLRIWHTENDGGVTLTNRNKDRDIEFKVKLYQSLIEEEFYFNVLKKYNPRKFQKRCLTAWLFLRMGGDQQGATFYKNKLAGSSLGPKNIFLIGLASLLSPQLLKTVYLKGWM